MFMSFLQMMIAAIHNNKLTFGLLLAAYVVLVLWSVAVLLAIVYLGEHYAVDALAGYAYVAVAAVLVEAFTRWRARRVRATPARPSS